jgi:hypothetical protein
MRITIPASVAYDLEALKACIVTVVGRLGCPTCFSGHDCHFQRESSFLVNEELEITSSRDKPEPQPWLTTNVTLPVKASRDLETIKRVVAAVAQKVSHPLCCSGFDILFQQETEYIVNESGEIRD